MADVVEVLIPVEAALASSLDDAGERELVGKIVSRLLRRRGAARVMEAIDALKSIAYARGLTDEIVDEELAAYKAEQRSRHAPLP